MAQVGEMRETIAGELRAHRARAKMTRRQVADAVGVDNATMSNYEHAASGISYETMWRLADMYGTSLDEMGGRPWPKREVDGQC